MHIRYYWVYCCFKMGKIMGTSLKIRFHANAHDSTKTAKIKVAMYFFYYLSSNISGFSYKWI